MKKTLNVPRSELTNESDFDCTYCNNTEKVKSCHTDDELALLCSGCGRHGTAQVSSEGDIKTGPFFDYIK